MKKGMTILMLCLSIGLQAQDQYTKAMSKALSLWGEGKNAESVAMFERILQVEKDNWIPAYYAANVLIVQSFESKDKTVTNELLESAKAHIAEAHKRSPENSEIVTLEGVLYTGYVAMDPAVYGMQYSGKIMKLHQKAISLDPENPRALANSIEFEMGSARFFGQDLTPLCLKMKEVLPKFDSQSSDIPFWPSYGKDRALQMSQQCDTKE